MDPLLPELLHLIAETDMATYYVLIRAYPRFARLITNGVRFDYAELFGITVSITKNRTAWMRNNEHHRADGPAIITTALCNSKNEGNYYYINGKLHRTGGPAIIRATGHTYYYIYGTELTRVQFLLYYPPGDKIYV